MNIDDKKENEVNKEINAEANNNVDNEFGVI